MKINKRNFIDIYLEMILKKGGIYLDKRLCTQKNCTRTFLYQKKKGLRIKYNNRYLDTFYYGIGDNMSYYNSLLILSEVTTNVFSK